MMGAAGRRLMQQGHLIHAESVMNSPEIIKYYQLPQSQQVLPIDSSVDFCFRYTIFSFV
jgi:hypothetical protein